MLTLILSSIGFAVPLQITQQGRILDGNGAGVSGLHDLTFRIYDAETSATLNAGNVVYSSRAPNKQSSPSWV